VSNTAVPLAPETVIRVRREWKSRRIGEVRFGNIEDLHWARTSGGIGHRSPFVMMYGYMLCDRLVGGAPAHSCVHGEGPHRIKIVVVKKDNLKSVIAALMAPLGPQLPRATLRLAQAGMVPPPRSKRARTRQDLPSPHDQDVVHGREVFEVGKFLREARIQSRPREPFARSGLDQQHVRSASGQVLQQSLSLRCQVGLERGALGW